VSQISLLRLTLRYGGIHVYDKIEFERKKETRWGSKFFLHEFPCKAWSTSELQSFAKATWRKRPLTSIKVSTLRWRTCADTPRVP